MERLDVIIAATGGVILVIAIVGATLGGGGTLAFDAKYAVKDVSATAPLAPSRTTATFAIVTPNVVSVGARVIFTATPVFAAGASAHVKLTSPEGNVTEKDLTAAPGASIMSGDVLTPVAQPPANETIQAANADAATRAAFARNSTLGLGNWTLEVSYASGAVPPAQVTGQLTWDWKSWEVVVTPAAPSASR